MVERAGGVSKEVALVARFPDKGESTTTTTSRLHYFLSLHTLLSGLFIFPVYTFVTQNGR